MDKDHEGGEGFPTMHHFSDDRKRRLNYIIHNPNTVEETAKTLLAVFMQVNEKKVEEKLRELAGEVNEKKSQICFTKSENSV